MIGHKFYVLKLMSMPVRFQEMGLLPLCFEESPWSPMSNKIHQLQSSKFCLYQLYLPDLRELGSFPFLYSKLQFFLNLKNNSEYFIPVFGSARGLSV